MCDGSHKTINQSSDHNTKQPMTFRSHKFQVDENKEYVLCNCKQTSNAPFCDGSHKQQWVQDAVLEWCTTYTWLMNYSYSTVATARCRAWVIY